MSSRSSRSSFRSPSLSAGKTWRWQRRINRLAREKWISRLQRAGCLSWALTEKPGQASGLIAAYFTSRSIGMKLVRAWGGRVSSISAEDWLSPDQCKPLRIGPKLQIVGEKPASQNVGPFRSLVIPHGIAFGSGEHATTAMLLRALARHRRLDKTAVLDLGTGSGILALAARALGARKIVAIDFDAAAIRTARDNEKLNFPSTIIQWRRADVKRLRVRNRYHLVLANLFSGILCEAAGQISRAIVPGGELWLSGILQNQQSEVVAAYEGRGLELTRALHRGKWVALQWRKPDLPTSKSEDSEKSSRRNKQSRQWQ